MFVIRQLFLTSLLVLLVGCATRPPVPSAFSFALMGDQQYNAREEALFPQMLDAVSKEQLEFVVHVGDFKAGGNAPCTDALFMQRKTEFNRSRHAFIYTPGDNDWVDCRRTSNGASDPLERLAKLREVFFSESRSLGQNTIALAQQSEMFHGDPVIARYRENAMWLQGGIVFATFNIQGSNDNFGFDDANDREHEARTRANIEWLNVAIKRAQEPDIAGVAIFLQANPGFEEQPADVAKSGFRLFLEAFEARATSLGKPILFAHGDTHQYRVDRPYLSPLDKRPIPNVTRVETFGSPVVNWVKITVDPNLKNGLFFIQPGGFAPP